MFVCYHNIVEDVVVFYLISLRMPAAWIFLSVSWGCRPFKWANGVIDWLIGWVDEDAFLSTWLLGNYKMPKVEILHGTKMMSMYFSSEKLNCKSVNPTLPVWGIVTCHKADSVNTLWACCSLLDEGGGNVGLMLNLHNTAYHYQYTLSIDGMLLVQLLLMIVSKIH